MNRQYIDFLNDAMENESMYKFSWFRKQIIEPVARWGTGVMNKYHYAPKGAAAAEELGANIGKLEKDGLWSPEKVNRAKEALQTHADMPAGTFDRGVAAEVRDYARQAKTTLSPGYEKQLLRNQANEAKAKAAENATLLEKEKKKSKWYGGGLLAAGAIAPGAAYGAYEYGKQKGKERGAGYQQAGRRVR